MAALIFLAFIIVPIAEIAIFIEVGGAIGLWNTVGLIVFTAIAGTALLRTQGLSALRKAQESFARHVFPVNELFDGLCLLVAGALLLTPGFATDTAGLALFVPWIRAALRHAMLRYLVTLGGARMWVDGEATGGPGDPARGDPRTIEGEFRNIDTDDDSGTDSGGDGRGGGGR